MNETTSDAAPTPPFQPIVKPDSRTAETSSESRSRSRPADSLALAAEGENRDRSRLPGLDERQRRRLDAVREQALAAPERDREDHQVELVDEVVREQRLHERRAARDEDVARELLLQAPRLPSRGRRRRSAPSCCSTRGSRAWSRRRTSASRSSSRRTRPCLPSSATPSRSRRTSRARGAARRLPSARRT